MTTKEKIYTYKIIELSEVFLPMTYSDPPYKEILHKNSRPYCMLLFDNGLNYNIAIPFRTNLNHNNGFHLLRNHKFYKQNPGIDYSKTVIITKTEYLRKIKTINDRHMVALIGNIATIYHEVSIYILDYINHMNGIKLLTNSEFNRKYKYTTLQYFHRELGISD